MNLLNSLYLKYKDSVNFVSIYIAEAHADDEWPIRTEKKLKIKQHQTIEDRQAAAKLLQEEYGWKIPLVLDSMENAFQTAYSGWPLRIVLIGNNRSPDVSRVEYASQQIKPYEGFLQFGLFKHLQKVLDSKLGIKKDSAAMCQDLIDFTANYKF